MEVVHFKSQRAKMWKFVTKCEKSETGKTPGECKFYSGKSGGLVSTVRSKVICEVSVLWPLYTTTMALKRKSRCVSVDWFSHDRLQTSCVRCWFVFFCALSECVTLLNPRSHTRQPLSAGVPPHSVSFTAQCRARWLIPRRERRELLPVFIPALGPLPIFLTTPAISHTSPSLSLHMEAPIRSSGASYTQTLMDRRN